MASLAYVSVPSSATRLQSMPPSSSSSSAPLQRAKKVVISLPTPTSAPSTPFLDSSTNSLAQSMTSPTSAAFALLPQMLLSSALPGPNGPSTPPKDKEKDARKGPQLLTTKEPLSIPITTANFKRFVAKSGPIFWMQDRVEEVVLWKRGWRVTAVWMAAYAFFCYFPKMVFAIPHMSLIAIMLASYPYSTNTKPGEAPASNSVDWQGNLQAIQNLMGAVSDAHDLVQPHTHLLQLTPAHLPSPADPPSPSPPTSSYPPLILLSLLLTFPPLVALLASPLFPTRLVCLVGGLAPLIGTHPHIRPLLGPLAKLATALADNVVVVLSRRYTELRTTYVHWMSTRAPAFVDVSDKHPPPPLQTLLERLRDNDRLDDTCWRAEMRDVELWENERLAPRSSPGPLPSAYPDGTAADANNTHSPSPAASFSGLPPEDMWPAPTPTPREHRFSLPPLPLAGGGIAAPPPDPADPGWGKAHLRGGERRAWTRGQDGWGGIRPRSRSGSAADEEQPQQQETGGEGEGVQQSLVLVGAGVGVCGVGGVEAG
ncbi:hypothetical protein DXG01_009801 [Tephrocybe rancida]|nr:hypothetical protein DXG01_009801 [Tephrocybe rancida]